MMIINPDTTFLMLPMGFVRIMSQISHVPSPFSVHRRNDVSRLVQKALIGPLYSAEEMFTVTAMTSKYIQRLESRGSASSLTTR